MMQSHPLQGEHHQAASHLLRTAMCTCCSSPWGRCRRMTLKYLEGVAMTRPMLMPYKIPSTTLTNTLYMGSTRFVRENPLLSPS